MKLLIFGSTGTIGRELVKQSLKQEHTVTAFARDPAKLDIKHNNLQVTRGDANGSCGGGGSDRRPRSSAVFTRGRQERYDPVRGDTTYHQRDGEGGRPTFNLPNDPWSRR